MEFRFDMIGCELYVEYALLGTLPNAVYIDPSDGDGFLKYVPERTCRIVCSSDGEFVCTECCGYMHESDNFRPTCGARVVE